MVRLADCDALRFDILEGAVSNDQILYGEISPQDRAHASKKTVLQSQVQFGKCVCEHSTVTLNSTEIHRNEGTVSESESVLSLHVYPHGVCRAWSFLFRLQCVTKIKGTLVESKLVAFLVLAQFMGGAFDGDPTSFFIAALVDDESSAEYVGTRCRYVVIFVH